MIGARVLTIRDDGYPKALRHIPDAPVVLYARGSLPPGERTLAVVGSRKASSEGISLAGKISETLSLAGIRS
jgi:DNA processing protein